MDIEIPLQDSPGAWQMQTDQFSGPLDLLPNLIESRKMYVNDVSLAAVTDDYIAHVSKLTSFPVAETAQFVVIAATLLLIKSRSLLPNLELTSDEEIAVGDLEARLKLYKVVRDASRVLAAAWLGHPALEPIRVSQPLLPFSPGNDLSIANVEHRAQEILKSLPTSIFRPSVSIERLPSLEEVIQRVAERVKSRIARFSELTGSAGKAHVILFFLAILELAKNNAVTLDQTSNFDDIMIKNDSIHGAAISTPNFS